MATTAAALFTIPFIIVPAPTRATIFFIIVAPPAFTDQRELLTDHNDSAALLTVRFPFLLT